MPNATTTAAEMLARTQHALEAGWLEPGKAGETTTNTYAGLLHAEANAWNVRATNAPDDFTRRVASQRAHAYTRLGRLLEDLRHYQPGA